MIYLDNAATTKIKPEVYEAMKPYLTDRFGNPSSIFYDIGQDTELAVANARKTIAECIGAKPSEIYFTSGGSEANNWAIKGAAFANKDKGNHIITSKIEHPSTLNTCKFLETIGFKVTYLDVDSSGRVSAETLFKAITDETILISIMWVNNETGTVQPIEAMAKMIPNHVLFHTDAVQAAGHMPMNLSLSNIDMLSMSGHKFHAPKGIGALYIREGTIIEPLIHGGNQERGMRAGTENVAGIIGMAKALKLSLCSYSGFKTEVLRRKLIDGISKSIPYVKYNSEWGVPYILNVSFDYVEAESAIILLNQSGICVSGGSACHSGSLEPSHVLTAMGKTPEEAHSAIRFSFSDETTEEEIDYVLQELPPIIQRLRDMSPAYENFIKEKDES